jgi:hypothetical protein
LEAKGDIFAMKSLIAGRIQDYNGLIIQAFKNLSLVANSESRHSSAFFLSKCKMGCPALGVWVAFLKQPTLPGEARIF